MSDPVLKAMQDTLAAIPQGQLSERQVRIAAAVSLVRDEGRTYKAASEATGVPIQTIFRYKHKMTEAFDDAGVAINAKALVAASFDVAQLASQRITERLLDEPESWGNGDLVKAYGVATDKIALKLRWRDGTEARESDEGVSAISKMLRGATIVMPRQDEHSDAIDVTPIESTGELSGRDEKGV